MPKVAVITCAYNSYTILKQCLQALVASSSTDVHAILIDQHSPDERTREFLKYVGGGQESEGFRMKAQHRSVAKWFTVLDPGRNLGTHNGFNYGFEHGVVGKGYDYVIKLDDDTVITTQDWDKLMVAGLEARSDIAFLSADGSLYAKQLDTWDVQKVSALVYEIPPRNIVDFHCVMFRVADMMRWERTQPRPALSEQVHDVMTVGPNEMFRDALGVRYQGRVWLTNPEGDGDRRLYGGEELYMARKARAEGKKIAYFRNVFCNHLDANDRCQDYQVWKYCYGILRSTDKPVDEWRASGEMLRDMRALVGAWALKQEGWARQYIIECVRRLGDIGEGRDAGALLLVAHGNPEGLGQYKPRTDMPEVIAECEKSAARIQERFKKKGDGYGAVQTLAMKPKEGA